MERKIEKSVRFASDNESHSIDKSDGDSVNSTTESADMITWIPSEQLYEDDTFISESQKECTSNGDDSRIPTDPSYGTNTFIDIESEDETRTLSEYSYTDSFASSGVFSSHSQSDRSTFREWREVTEIVKDIEELEESEYVNKTDSLQLKFVQNEEADITESEAEELVEVSQQNFLNSTVRRLKLKDLQSPQDLPQESFSYEPLGRRVTGSHKVSTFCQKMIANCQRIKSSTTQAPSQDIEESKPHNLEYYGLSSAILEKLKTESFQHWLKKKLADIEADTQKSLEYIRANQHSEDVYQKEKFIKQIRSCVLKENMDDCIQAHLISMHPVKWFSDLINDLPKPDEDAREILYKYRRQVESRIQGNG